jgi:SmpA / OmlA family
MGSLTRAGAAAFAAAWLLLAGCDQQRIEKLEEGVATEADVRQQFGEPAAVFNQPDGSRVFEYPRQPEGRVNYFITIGADGKMAALRQVLRADVFGRVQPGMDKAELRRLLGRPARSQTFKLKNEEVWDWRWLDGQQKKVFSVTFDTEGKVRSSASVDDPGELYTGGGAK